MLATVALCDEALEGSSVTSLLSVVEEVNANNL